MAEVKSIQCNKRPPAKLPKELVSLGNTISVVTVLDSEGVLNFAMVQKYE